MLWLDAQAESVRAEIRVEKRRGRVIIRFVHAPDLRGALHQGMLSVAEIKYGLRWRVMFDRDCLPLATEDRQGFYCGFCDKREIFKTREELWADHLFEPFKRWVIDGASKTDTPLTRPSANHERYYPEG